MELSFKNLKKREVVNVVDGKSFGHPVDINLTFPSGAITGIFVPNNDKCFLNFLSKNTLYIDKQNIIKIGGDVILVSLKCGDTCEESVSLNQKKKSCINPCNPCASMSSDGDNGLSDRIDLTDY